MFCLFNLSPDISGSGRIVTIFEAVETILRDLLESKEVQLPLSKMSSTPHQRCSSEYDLKIISLVLKAFYLVYQSRCFS